MGFFISSLAIFAVALFLRQSSSQTCYYDKGKEANEMLKNCSRLDTGKVAHCCWAGHVCLEHNACWDSISGATYQYGCTDPEYEDDEKCPKKCDLNRAKTPWVGLIKDGCSDDNKTWTCNHPDSCGTNCPQDVAVPWADQPHVLPPGVCSDLKLTRTAFLGNGGDLSAIATLSSVGPQSPSPPDPTTTSALASTESPPNDGLSSTTKLAIGLGVGLGGAIIILSSVLLALYLVRRRRSAKASDPASALPAGQPQAMAAPPYSPNHSTYPNDHKYMAPEMSQAPGFQAELSADAMGMSYGHSMQHSGSNLNSGEIVSPVVSPMIGGPVGSTSGFDNKAPAELPVQNWGR